MTNDFDLTNSDGTEDSSDDDDGYWIASANEVELTVHSEGEVESYPITDVEPIGYFEAPDGEMAEIVDGHEVIRGQWAFDPVPSEEILDSFKESMDEAQKRALSQFGAAILEHHGFDADEIEEELEDAGVTAEEIVEELEEDE